MNQYLDSTPEAIAWAIGLFIAGVVVLLVAGFVTGVWLGTSRRAPEQVVLRRHCKGAEERRSYRRRGT